MNFKPKVASFFSGAGGMDLGFEKAGYEIFSCMDIESWACETLKINHPNAIVIGPPNYSGNIKKISPEEYSEITNAIPGSIDVFTGGPPCQPFSQAAAQRFLKGDERFKRKGFDDYEKGTLLFDYISYIEYFKPRVFILENVPGLLTLDDGIQLDEALSRLRAIGYKHSVPEITEASNYGVPQCRSRLIIWGTLDNKVIPTLPDATHGGGLFLKRLNTVADALYKVSPSLPNHETREHKPESISRYRTLDFGQREKTGRVDRLDPTKPSKTVIAGGSNGGGRSHLHPFIARTLSVRECARIQTFPDSYVFQGSIARQFTQVGNAVPPLLAEHFARKIGREVFDMTYEKSFELEKQFEHHKSLQELTEILLKESLETKPEWIYFTHSKN